MKVDVRCFANLANRETCDYRKPSSYDLDDGQTVEILAHLAGIAPEAVKIIFVNGRKKGLHTVLSEGDRVGLVPAVGGM